MLVAPQAGNILIDRDGAVKLADFGVAATLERNGSWGHDKQVGDPQGSRLGGGGGKGGGGEVGVTACKWGPHKGHGLGVRMGPRVAWAGV